MKTSKRTLRQLTREQASSEEISAIHSEILRGSDRTAAILLTAHLQDALCRLIIEHLPRKDTDTINRLHERDGPLSSFFSQIHLAYAMNLFDSDIRADLEAIRHVRNAFAHALKPISFRTPEVARQISKIRSPASQYLTDADPSGSVSRRERFISCGKSLLLCFHYLNMQALMEKIPDSDPEKGRIAKAMADLRLEWGPYFIKP